MSSDAFGSALSGVNQLLVVFENWLKAFSDMKEKAAGWERSEKAFREARALLAKAEPGGWQEQADAADRMKAAMEAICSSLPPGGQEAVLGKLRELAAEDRDAPAVSLLRSAIGRSGLSETEKRNGEAILDRIMAVPDPAHRLPRVFVPGRDIQNAVVRDLEGRTDPGGGGIPFFCFYRPDGTMCLMTYPGGPDGKEPDYVRVVRNVIHKHELTHGGIMAYSEQDLNEKLYDTFRASKGKAFPIIQEVKGLSGAEAEAFRAQAWTVGGFPSCIAKNDGGTYSVYFEEADAKLAMSLLIKAELPLRGCMAEYEKARAEASMRLRGEAFAAADSWGEGFVFNPKDPKEHIQFGRRGFVHTLPDGHREVVSKGDPAFTSPGQYLSELKDRMFHMSKDIVYFSMEEAEKHGMLPGASHDHVDDGMRAAIREKAAPLLAPAMEPGMKLRQRAEYNFMQWAAKEFADADIRTAASSLRHGGAEAVELYVKSRSKSAGGREAALAEAKVLMADGGQGIGRMLEEASDAIRATGAPKLESMKDYFLSPDQSDEKSQELRSLADEKAERLDALESAISDLLAEPYAAQAVREGMSPEAARAAADQERVRREREEASRRDQEQKEGDMAFLKATAAVRGIAWYEGRFREKINMAVAGASARGNEKAPGQAALGAAAATAVECALDRMNGLASDEAFSKVPAAIRARDIICETVCGNMEMAGMLQDRRAEAGALAGKEWGMMLAQAEAEAAGMEEQGLPAPQGEDRGRFVEWRAGILLDKRTNDILHSLNMEEAMGKMPGYLGGLSADSLQAAVAGPAASRLAGEMSAAMRSNNKSLDGQERA